MGAKNCPETPRQKMINMMYIVLTAMLALNVAAEVLEAFRVVDASLTQTIQTVDMKNKQIYSSFEQAYTENPTKVHEWKEKADLVKSKTDTLINQIWDLKEELVYFSGAVKIEGDIKLRDEDPKFITQYGDTLRVKKEDDLNSPSEMMITKGKAEELKNKINGLKNFLIQLINEEDSQLSQTLLQELNTENPPSKSLDGGERKSWEVQHFDNKPLIAVLTLLSKIQIDIKNSEAHVINYLYSQIDAGSFKFNKLGARVIANSNIIFQGDEYFAEIFLAAEDTTQSPEIYIGNQKVPVIDGKATYRVNTTTPGTFSWKGLIRYKTPEGIFQEYPFEQEYQVTQPTVTVSATKMNVFYRGIANPIDIGGSIPIEDLRPTMTNGRIEKQGDQYFVYPTALDELGRRTKVSIYSTVGGEQRLLDTKPWRVKRVPDPVAQVAGISTGDLRRELLVAQQGIFAVLEDFDFDYKYTITEFVVNTITADGYTNPWPATSNRFTADQKEQFSNLRPNSYIYINNIKARGDNGDIRELDAITFKIR